MTRARTAALKARLPNEILAQIALEACRPPPFTFKIKTWVDNAEEKAERIRQRCCYVLMLQNKFLYHLLLPLRWHTVGYDSMVPWSTIDPKFFHPPPAEGLAICKHLQDSISGPLSSRRLDLALSVRSLLLDGGRKPPRFGSYLRHLDLSCSNINELSSLFAILKAAPKLDSITLGRVKEVVSLSHLPSEHPLRFDLAKQTLKYVHWNSMGSSEGLEPLEEICSFISLFNGVQHLEISANLTRGLLQGGDSDCTNLLLASLSEWQQRASLKSLLIRHGWGFELDILVSRLCNSVPTLEEILVTESSCDDDHPTNLNYFQRIATGLCQLKHLRIVSFDCSFTLAGTPGIFNCLFTELPALEAISLPCDTISEQLFQSPPPATLQRLGFSLLPDATAKFYDGPFCYDMGSIYLAGTDRLAAFWKLAAAHLQEGKVWNRKYRYGSKEFRVGGPFLYQAIKAFEKQEDGQAAGESYEDERDLSDDDFSDKEPRLVYI